MGKKLSGKIAIKKAEPPIFYSKILEDHPQVETRTDFSTVVGGTVLNNETTSGVIYKTTKESEKEEGEEIYYFAGNPSDNWVKFAGYYWRIIRTNHDKSVRLLYAGTSPSTTGGYIESAMLFNDDAFDAMDVGWKYGTTGSLDNNRTNENSSTIRTIVLEWFNTNIKPNYNKYISYDAIYCNDRSGDAYDSSKTIYFAGYNRLYNKNDKPTYQCGMNTIGGFYDSDNKWQSGGMAETLYRDASDLDKFKDGIGLMTADEISFAGGSLGTKAPNTYYSRNSLSVSDVNSETKCHATGNKAWWTMTPYNYQNYVTLFYVLGNGNLSANIYNYYSAVRPVISLKNIELVSGSGTSDDPYVIESD